MKMGARALLPTLLLALVTFWAGNFSGVATAYGALAWLCAILLFSLLAGSDYRDPLALGRNGRWLLAALVVLTVISWWASPVERAGRVGLILLPACLLVPAATANCWNSAAARRRGLDGISILVLAVSLVSLVSWQVLSLPRAALPLGHHTLLAGWLTLLLPLAVLPARTRGVRRWLALGSGLTAIAALLASGSLLGGLALAAQSLGAAAWWRRSRRWLLPLAALILLALLPRLLRISHGVDPSAWARMSYLTAGSRGVAHRPILGWGPGAVAWTIARFMNPTEGVNPATEIVGDLHSLPAQIAYELGTTGLLLTAAIIVVFGLRRLHETRTATDPATAKAALLGLLGGAVFTLGSAPLAVPALPMAAAVVAGAALRPGERRRAPSPPRRPAPPIVYVVAAGLLLLPVTRAHLHYDRARRAATAEASLTGLARAVELDPGFPLYRARAAWLRSELTGESEAADDARRAAVEAHALAPLWLAAGHLGRLAERPWATDALERAHRLDPLSPLTSFHLMMARPDSPDAVDLGARALRIEPRLARAEFWRQHPSLAGKVAERTAIRIPAGRVAVSPEPLALALSMDRKAALSFSLYAFRRSPWPAWLAPVAVQRTSTPGRGAPHPGDAPELE